MFTDKDIVLTGKHIRLEPLSFLHLNGLVEATRDNPELFRWTYVPQDVGSMLKYIDTALVGLHAGTSVPFAIVRLTDERIVGSTRFSKIEHWNWPDQHERCGRITPDVCEIGYSWLTASAQRTMINTEAKFMLLQHAFEKWEVMRVSLQTDIRNLRSRSAIQRIGGKLDGIVRADRIGADCTIRDTARYSIIDHEWDDVKLMLCDKLYLKARQHEFA